MTSPVAAPHPQSDRPAVSLVHAAFVLNGAVTTFLAPALPLLAARWTLSDEQAGRLFTAQFLGSITGNVVSLWLTPRHGFRVALGFGYLLIAAGFAALSFAPWPAALACTLLFGIGVGLTIPASNVFIAESRSARAGAALNILNFAWTAGAIACPWIVAAVRNQDAASWLLRSMAVASACAAALIFALRWPAAAHDRQARSSFSAVPHAMALLAMLGALFFLYIGTEAAFVGWISTFGERVGGAGTAAVAVPSFFWAAVLLARIAAPAVLRRFSEATVTRAGLALAAIGAAVALVSTNLAGVIVGVTLAGLGLAPVFPLFLAYMARSFGPAAARAASLLYILGGLGGACLPLLVGMASTRLSSLKVGLALPAIAIVLMLGLHLAGTPRNAEA
jgi:MFS transporter, FHS family, glucose/mannose:H+ symporter